MSSPPLTKIPLCTSFYCLYAETTAVLRFRIYSHILNPFRRGGGGGGERNYHHILSVYCIRSGQMGIIFDSGIQVKKHSRSLIWTFGDISYKKLRSVNPIKKHSRSLIWTFGDISYKKLRSVNFSFKILWIRIRKYYIFFNIACSILKNKLHHMFHKCVGFDGNRRAPGAKGRKIFRGREGQKKESPEENMRGAG